LFGSNINIITFENQNSKEMNKGTRKFILGLIISVSGLILLSLAISECRKEDWDFGWHYGNLLIGGIIYWNGSDLVKESIK
jgi:hypothetical protein